MKQLLLILTLLSAQISFAAAPRCLDLSKAKAEKAVKLMKIALYQGGTLRYVSKKESGFVKPLGVWSEKKGHAYRVRVDGREVDLSLVYLNRSSKENRGWNLAWMVGCRPAAGKAESLRFEM